MLSVLLCDEPIDATCMGEEDVGPSGQFTYGQLDMPRVSDRQACKRWWSSLRISVEGVLGASKPPWGGRAVW